MDNLLFTLHTSAVHYGSDTATLVNACVYTSCAAALTDCDISKPTNIRRHDLSREEKITF